MTKPAHHSKSRSTPLVFHVGDRVRLNSPGRFIEGVIVEDRGLIGVHGRRILRLKAKPDPENSDPEFDLIFEVPADEVEVVESA